MKKTLRYLLLAVLTTMFGAAQAQDIVIDFNAMSTPTIPGLSATGVSDGDISAENGLANGWSYNQDGVTIIVSPKEQSNSNENRFWGTSNGPQLRCYSGTITISYTSSMKNIEFDATSNFNMTANTGVLEGKTWEGSGQTTRVVFSVSKNTQINKITITPGVGNAQGGGGDEPPVDEPTFDFTQNDYGMTATSDGNSYEDNPCTFSSGDVSVTVTGDKGCRLWITESSGAQDFRFYKAGTMTISVPQGKVVQKVVFTGNKVSAMCGPDGKTLVDGTWEGSLNAPSFTCTATQYINTITVTYGTGSETPIVVTYTDMTMSEATAKSLEGTAMKNINLKLNNALVVYDFVKGNNEGFFVREGDYAIEFYNTGLGLKAGQTITGSIKCNLSPYNYTPEVVKADDASVTNLNDVTLGTGTVTPIEMTADEAYNGETHLGDLVVVKEAPVVTEENEDTGALMYYVQCTGHPQYDKDNNFTGYGEMRIYDYFGGFTFPEIPASYVPTFDIKAIYVANSKTTRRLWVLDMKTPGQEDEATAIQAVTTEQTDGAIYNLQGQRISQPARGLYIQNGRKYIAK